jgi:azurin
MKKTETLTRTQPTNHTGRLGLIFAAALAAGTLLVACGDGTDSTTATPGTPSTPAAAEPTTEVFITGNDEMQFSKTAFTVKAGETVRVIFKNVGTMPKESMGHDWLLLKDSADAAQFVEDGFAFASSGYIAPEHKNDVLAHTKIIGPGETANVIFTAPTKPGPYDYVCSFPGHYAAGMKGVMTVE